MGNPLKKEKGKTLRGNLLKSQEKRWPEKKRDTNRGKVCLSLKNEDLRGGGGVLHPFTRGGIRDGKRYAMD